MPGDRRQILSLLRLPIPPLQPASNQKVSIAPNFCLLREGGRRGDFLPAFSVECGEKSQQILLGLLIHIKGCEASVEVGVRQPSLRVEIQDLTQRSKAAVMHIGRAMGKIAQS